MKNVRPTILTQFDSGVTSSFDSGGIGIVEKRESTRSKSDPGVAFASRIARNSQDGIGGVRPKLDSVLVSVADQTTTDDSRSVGK
jgi:hypothetical protein